jgi:CubicO group peptidase (beta-lactamase class C family)
MPEYRRDMMLGQTTEQMVARFRDKPLEFEPGAKYKYNNSGYFLLGVIIENASGVKYDVFLRQEIFEPLGMKDTGYDRFQAVLKRRATGYSRWRAGKLANAAYVNMSQPYAAGALYSTVEDMSRWDQALRRRELISEANYRVMWTPVKSNYAYGWISNKAGGRRKLSHGGGINGFRSQIDRYPDQKLCVVVLCNEETMNPRKVAQDLAAIVLGLDYETPKK